MKKAFRILAYFLSGFIVLSIIAIAFISFALPRVDPAPDMKVEMSAEQIARGKYLANHVMQCVDCHSVRDFGHFSGPPVPGTELAGGERFDQSMGFPGVYISPNITPAGIGEWTDGEIFRLITTGIKRDGEPIFPVMPYPNFAQVDEEDIKAVIAYIRSVEPVVTDHPKSKSDFPMNLILRTMPRKVAFTKKPDPTDQVAYGKYLVTAASCGECHTKFEGGSFTGALLAGGREFLFPNGAILRSPNLTPAASGLKNWDKQQFVSLFKNYSDSSYSPHQVQPGEYQTIMPWMMYAGLTNEDLEAIFIYLQTLTPVESGTIERFTAGR